jgi:hypothetical protein
VIHGDINFWPERTFSSEKRIRQRRPSSASFNRRAFSLSHSLWRRTCSRFLERNNNKTLALASGAECPNKKNFFLASADKECWYIWYPAATATAATHEKFCIGKTFPSGIVSDSAASDTFGESRETYFMPEKAARILHCGAIYKARPEAKRKLRGIFCKGSHTYKLGTIFYNWTVCFGLSILHILTHINDWGSFLRTLYFSTSLFLSLLYDHAL